jgi:hypothetical protein
MTLDLAERRLRWSGSVRDDDVTTSPDDGAERKIFVETESLSPGGSFINVG